MGISPRQLPTPDDMEPEAAVQIWMPSKHMGNLLLSLRAMETLVAYYSAERCTLVVDEAYRQLLAATDIAARVLHFPRRAIAADGPAVKIGRVTGFVAATRRPRPLLAIALEGDKVSKRFLPLSGCRYAVGPDNRYCRGYQARIPLDHGERHVFFDYAAVAKALTGFTPAPGYASLRATEKSRDEVTELLGRDMAQPPRPYIVLHPCATKEYKQWPVASFARLAESLAEREIDIVLTGAGEFDRATIAQLQALCRHPLLSLHDRLNLDQLVALLNGAEAFVGNDTGPTHLAAAAGAPTFALFGPTDEAMWGPLGERTRILRSEVPCEPTCLRRRCGVDYRCMRTLSPEAVSRMVLPCL